MAYVSLNSPVRGTETLRATASPTLLQHTSDIQRVSITAAAAPAMTADNTATHHRSAVLLATWLPLPLPTTLIILQTFIVPLQPIIDSDITIIGVIDTEQWDNLQKSYKG